MAKKGSTFNLHPSELFFKEYKAHLLMPSTWGLTSTSRSPRRRTGSSSSVSQLHASNELKHPLKTEASLIRPHAVIDLHHQRSCDR